MLLTAGTLLELPGMLPSCPSKNRPRLSALSYLRELRERRPYADIVVKLFRTSIRRLIKA